jgi:AcrR family transcriptional regulator
VAQRKIEILEAARDLFAERGFEKTTMADIAVQVGVVESALYRHYRSKQELLVETIRAFYEPIIEDLERAEGSLDEPLARIRCAVRRQLRVYAEEPALCRLVLDAARRLEPQWAAEIVNLNRRYTAFVVRAVSDGVAGGVFPAGTRPALIRDLIYGWAEHIGWNVLTQGVSLDVDHLTAEMMAVLEPALTARVDHAEQLRAEVDRLARLVEGMGTAVPRRPGGSRAH